MSFDPYVMAYKCVMATSFRVQVTAMTREKIEEIFHELQRILPPESIKRSVSSPFFEIILLNGSRIRGFHKSIRVPELGIGLCGQQADLLWCYDYDEYSQDDVNSLIAMKVCSPDTELVKR